LSIKVSNVKSPDPGRFAARGAGARSASESEPLMFKRTLTDLTNELYAARISELKKKIDEQGQRLADKVDVKEFEKYRALIREFIDEIVSNGYTFSREDSFASHGRHRYTATVKIVNEKLDELGKEVMQEQADAIGILSRIDDIRGLLLDLMI
jgi:uncharacterized protein YaaR (DUF327 family)